MNGTSNLLPHLPSGDIRALARAISIVENEAAGYGELLGKLQPHGNAPVVGITGPPGAGKSTLLNVLISQLLRKKLKIAILAIDPTSPFNYGALLGDRIRLSQHYNNPNVFIRSLATRGSLGGLSDKIIEVTEVVKAAPFDYIFIETVGVGQSEVEVASLADTTIVVMVPEAGDEIQTMKAGLMEIADIFVVNKADRPEADHFAKNLRKLVHARPKGEWSVPVIKAVATKGTGVDTLIEQTEAHQLVNANHSRKAQLLTRKALQLIQKHRMRNINQHSLFKTINDQLTQSDTFNLYAFLKKQQLID